MGEAFLGWLLDLGWVYFGPALTFLILSTFFYRGLWEHDGDRKAAMARLTASSFHQAYRAGMERVLAGMDTRLSSAELAHGMGPGRVAFSSGLLQRMMLLAVAYPIVMLIGQWGFGGPIIFGEVDVPPDGDGRARVYLGLWVTSFAVGFVFLLKLVWLRHRAGFFALVCLATLACLVGVALARGLMVPAEVVGPAILTLFVIFLATAHFVGRREVTDALVLEGESTIAVATAVALAVTSAVAIAGGQAMFAGFFVALLVAMFVGWKIERSENKQGPLPGLWIWWLATLALGLASILQTRHSIYEATDSMIVSFFGFLPILNAVADFASVGLTRYLLRRGLNGVTIWNAILDVLGGLLIFFLLGFAAITLFHVIHPRDGVRLIDLPGLFEGLRHSPGDNWWLAVMLGSTLLPTVLHAMIGMFTVLTRYPVVLRDRVVALLRDDLPSNRKWGTAAYCVMVTLSIWVPIWALVALFSVNHGAVLRGVIVVFEGYARMIGAL